MHYLIVAGGTLIDPQTVKEKLKKYHKIIAVDRGYDHCINLNLLPDVLIGDMDSISADKGEVLKSNNTLVEAAADKSSLHVITANSEKDDTDLKLAVGHAIENGAQSITFLCATGGRMDHFLNNLSILEYTYDQGITCEILDEVNRITILEGEKTFQNISEYISLIPITQTITVSGTHLKYPMEQLEVCRKDIISISNESTSECFMLDVINGKAFIIQAD